MPKLAYLRRFVIFLVLFATCLWLYGYSRVEARLSIGSDAPPLDIEHWIQQGGGKFAKVTNFEEGKVYVVEFWATWCGPCIKSMPHLVELQEKYADQKVQIISVSDEPLEDIKEFLQRPAGQKDGKLVTFDELTSAYCLTTDPDGSTTQDYPVAARQGGIPCSFIVGKDSKIEWIGHPAELEGPLTKILAGTWDRQAFAIVFKEEQEMEELEPRLGAILQNPDGRQPTKEAFEEALLLIDDLIARWKSPRNVSQAKFIKLNLLIQHRPDDPQLVQVTQELFTSFAQQPSQLFALAWGIYEISNAGHLKNRQLVEIALKESLAVIDQVPAEERGASLDTIAHLQEYLGDIPAALASAKEAAKAPDASPEADAYVASLEMALKKSSDPKSTGPSSDPGTNKK
jgi:thiol-disulfide isomerase/thioredoxin